MKADFTQSLSTFIDKYDGETPIDISFRDLVPNFSSIERATHSIHPYPAKLLGHIPYFFLNNSIFSKPNDIVLDPFCGSGTVLLESILSGKNAYGIDSNPLARLISLVKSSLLDDKKIQIQKKLFLETYSKTTFQLQNVPLVVNLGYWYTEEIIKQLSNILYCIKQIKDENIKNFFLISFSVCARKVSSADPRVSVPVKLKPKSYEDKITNRKTHKKLLEELENINVLEKFINILELNQRRFINFKKLANTNNFIKIVGLDAKKITSNIASDELLQNESIDYIITSPPYAGAQKYIRASSLNLNWTELASATDLKILDNNTIGRESYRKEYYSKFQETPLDEANCFLQKVFEINPLRAYIASNYLNEMNLVILELYRVLKKKKYFVLIAANNFICGQEFQTQRFLKQLGINAGFKVKLELIDDIHSYGLMTKRNKTASIITRELVTVFQK